MTERADVAHDRLMSRSPACSHGSLACTLHGEWFSLAKES